MLGPLAPPIVATGDPTKLASKNAAHTSASVSRRSASTSGPPRSSLIVGLAANRNRSRSVAASTGSDPNPMPPDARAAREAAVAVLVIGWVPSAAGGSIIGAGSGAGGSPPRWRRAAGVLGLLRHGDCAGKLLGDCSRRLPRAPAPHWGPLSLLGAGEGARVGARVPWPCCPVGGWLLD